ncbi:MAG: hypothetical protein JW870_01845 [Candidatus Delongbacteria bacterium]|nr:hypothetical protein [Candidatus Delongbacteria bacterium]
MEVPTTVSGKPLALLYDYMFREKSKKREVKKKKRVDDGDEIVDLFYGGDQNTPCFESGKSKCRPFYFRVTLSKRCKACKERYIRIVQNKNVIRMDYTAFVYFVNMIVNNRKSCINSKQRYIRSRVYL